MISNDQPSQVILPGDQPNQPTEPPSVSGTDYEQMYHLLHAYRFGAISFLELLDAFEQVLHLKTHANPDDTAILYETQLTDDNRCVG